MSTNISTVENFSKASNKSILYKISDVARLLGTTSETIRNYEEHGIVKPVKSRSTGYRYFNTWDLHLLGKARAYRKFGYTISDTVDLINNYEIPDILSSMNKKEADIEKDISLHMNLLKLIRQMQSILADAHASIGKFRIEQRPAFYRIDTQDGYRIRSDANIQELFNAWNNMGPFVSPSALFEKSQFEQGSVDYSFGLVVGEEYADLLDIKESENVEYFPSRLCVYSAVQSHTDNTLSFQTFNHIIDHVKSMGMTLCDDIISRVVIYNKRGEKYYNLHQVWLPIE